MKRKKEKKTPSPNVYNCLPDPPTPLRERAGQLLLLLLLLDEEPRGSLARPVRVVPLELRHIRRRVHLEPVDPRHVPRGILRRPELGTGERIHAMVSARTGTPKT